MVDRRNDGTFDPAEALASRLAANPNDAQAYHALHDHYAQCGDFASLANLVAGYATYIDDPHASSAAYQQAAELCEQRLGDDRRAEGYYRKALARSPQNVGASEGLQALLDRQQRFRELVELIEQQLEQLSHRGGAPADLAVLCYRLGEIWSKRFDRVDHALGYYQRAYEADPRLLRAVYEARLLHLHGGELRQAAGLYEREASAETDAARKALLLRELAELYQQLDDRDGAVSALERAHEISPVLPITHALATALLSRAQLLDDRTRLADLGRVADLLYEIASASPDPEEAQAFLASALDHAPWHEAALTALERSTPAGDQATLLATRWVAYLAYEPTSEAADARRVALASAYADASQPEDALFCLAPAVRRGHAAAISLDRRLRASVLPASVPVPPPATPVAPRPEDADFVTQLGRIDLIDALREEARVGVGPWSGEPTSPGEPPPSLPDERATEPPPAQHAPKTFAAVRTQDAIELAEAALERDPLDAEAFALAERHYRRTREFDKRARLLLRCSAHEAVPLELRKQRLREAVNLLETRLSDADGALRAYELLLALEPGSEDVLRGRKRLLERTKRWDELCEVLEVEADAQAELGAKVALLRRVTELHRRERGDRGAAARTLARIVTADPTDRAARTALTEELVALGDFPAAAELLEQRIGETSGKSERLPLLRQLASLRQTQLDDVDGAYATYQRIVELVPDDATALERMEEIDEQLGAHERLLSTLQRRAAHAAAAQAANLCVRMATIAEADLLDRERAATYLQAALSHAPGNSEILTALANLYERAERYAELLELLRERAGAERSPKARAELYRRIGRLSSQRLHDDAAAADAFARVLDHGEDGEALAFLEGEARARDDSDRLLELLGRLAALEPTPERKRGRLLERADLLVAAGRAADAIESLLRVLLDLGADDAEPEAKLRALAAQLGDFRCIARLQEHRLEAEAEPARRAALARELAELYEGALADEPRAIRALSEWTAAAPEDVTPLRRLAAIFARKRRHKELVAVLDALARASRDGAERQDALYQAAELLLLRLKDDSGAFERLRELATTTAGPLPRRVIDLARKAGRINELCDLCESTGRPLELFALLEERIAAEAAPAPKLALLRRLARSQVELAQDEAAALATWDRALALGDDAEALRFVQAWALRHDDPERLCTALERLSRSEPDRTERRDLTFERARLLHTRLSRSREALPLLEETLKLDGRFEPALDELITVAEVLDEHATLATALERKLGHARTVDEKVELLRRAATLYEGPLHDERKALHALGRWAEQDGDDPEPWRRLRRLHSTAGRSRELLGVLDALARAETTLTARIEATVAAAKLAHEALADPDGAFERLAPFVPDADETVDATLLSLADRTGRKGTLYTLLERAERLPDLVQLLEADAKPDGEPKARAALLRRAAALAATALHDDARARADYEGSLALEESAEALRFLQAQALLHDEVETLAGVLARLAALETDPLEQRDLLYEHAHLLRLRLGRPREALAVLQRVVTTLDPQFEPALDELLSAAEAAGDDAALADALERILAREADPQARAELSQRLALLYEGSLRDDARALGAWLSWASADKTALPPRRRARALLERGTHDARLLACLDEIGELTDDAAERGEVRLRAARLCAGPLGQPDEAFARLVPLVREQDAAADQLLQELAAQHGRGDDLVLLYEELGRHDDVVALLRQRAETEPDDARRADLYLRCAEILATAVGDELAATEAYREVLALREDAAALHYLRGAAERMDDVETLEDLLRRLALLQDDRAQKRELLLARALLLADRLDRTADAIEVLRHVVVAIDPSCLPAIDELILASEASGNLQTLALGLERKLALTQDQAERAALALRLADLYEQELDQPSKAADALRRYCEAARGSVEGYRRLRPHLERQRPTQELLQVLDALASLETSKAARHEALLSAAKVAHEALGDSRGALSRLAPLVDAGDAPAEHLAETVCRGGGLGRELAGLYIRRAQAARSQADTRTSWQKVVQIHETWLSEPAEAFEASLRLLATDPSHAAFLDDADRLGVALGAFGRLSQVYGKLSKDAAAAAERARLLLRLSSLLEVHAHDPAAALDAAMEAARAEPANDDALHRVEGLSRRLGSHAELLWVQEQRAARPTTPEQSALALIEAARTADIGLGDREQAMVCMERALALSEHMPELAPRLRELASELDRARPSLGKDDARRMLVRLQQALAARSRDPFRTQLLLSAATLLREELSDDSAAFDLLRQGTSAPPCSAEALDALEAAAVRIGRLDALNAHLARAAEKAGDRADRLALLSRRARVLETRLGRYDQAAQAYERVLELDPDSEAHAASLLQCLKRAGRYRELLNACDKRLARTDDVARRLDLMREMAAVWEVELKNRAGAIEVWNEVVALAPDDAEAASALARLAGNAR